MARNLIAFGFIAGLVALLLLTNISMATTGTENISLSSYSVNTVPGGSIAVNYTLSLTNGYYSSGTTLAVVNTKQLIAQNITVLLTDSFGNPPVKGTMYVFLPHSLAPGSYNATLNGSSQGIAISQAVLRFNVASQGSNTITTTSIISTSVASTTSIVKTTAASTTSTAATTTILASTYSSSNSGTFYLLVAIIVVLTVVIVVLLINMKAKTGGQKKQPANDSK